MKKITRRKLAVLSIILQMICTFSIFPAQGAYTYAFPQAVSKKGLQVCASMIPDAVDLGVAHSLINMVISDMIATPSERNTAVSYCYRYNGKDYWFRKGVIGSYDMQLSPLKEVNAVCSAVLLLAYRSDLSYMIPPAARGKSQAFYALDTTNKDACDTLTATMKFLASRYSSPSAPHGRIVNWIWGNEVSNVRAYYYAGDLSLNKYAKLYADAFRLVYRAVTSIYAYSRCYISLDHLWNVTQNGSFTSRAMLDAFAKQLAKGGAVPWNLAYHAYSSPLTEPRFWENKNRQLTAALTTPVINMGNLNVLTDYIKSNYGSNTRIILSEQGYTSVQNGKKAKKTERAQSAAIAYSYLIAESNDMVDSFIMNRHVDHTTETAQGLNLGLWTTSRIEWADKKKDSWTVYKYMDTDMSESFTRNALKTIGAKSWEELLPNYSKELYSKYSSQIRSLVYPGSYKKRKSVSTGWTGWGAYEQCRKSKSTWTINFHSSANQNLLWGLTQNFKNISFYKYPYLYTTVQVSNTAAKKALLSIKFYSGNNVLTCSGVIPTGKSIKVGAGLQGWQYAAHVTKIQILVSPYNASLGTEAIFTVKRPVRGK